ncbi:MAG: copper resistance protein CopC, partial [Anaerolineaceae bacterium]|nr:copper resistance protein CopC [Anaerolineaceae bacterium]
MAPRPVLGAARQGLAALLLALCLLAGLPVPGVQAHANLLRSDPPAGAVLEESPGRFSLEFSESLDPHFTRLRLLDPAGQVLAEGPGEVDSADPRRLAFTPPVLPEGVYTLVWQVRSAVDGHITSGTIGFSVGVQGPRGSLLPPVGAADPAEAFPLAPDVLLRWANYAAAALMLGPLWFALLVWPRPGADFSRWLARTAGWAALALALAWLAFVLYQAQQLTRQGLQADFWTALAGLSGVLAWLRLLLPAALFLWARRLPPPAPGRPAAWGGAAARGAGERLVIALQSPAAAQGAPLAVALDWLHLVAMAAWLGGLAPLGIGLRRGAFPAAGVVPRFSARALAAV